MNSNNKYSANYNLWGSTKELFPPCSIRANRIFPKVLQNKAHERTGMQFVLGCTLKATQILCDTISTGRWNRRSGCSISERETCKDFSWPTSFSGNLHAYSASMWLSTSSWWNRYYNNHVLSHISNFTQNKLKISPTYPLSPSTWFHIIIPEVEVDCTFINFVFFFPVVHVI